MTDLAVLFMVLWVVTSGALGARVWRLQDKLTAKAITIADVLSQHKANDIAEGIAYANEMLSRQQRELDAQQAELADHARRVADAEARRDAAIQRVRTLRTRTVPHRQTPEERAEDYVKTVNGVRQNG